eukprot:TRINITY_DN3373_c0_g1_i1.p1 TRINITY_DN3373_c0_g1~~TRINITY_DN3373_c0_g1_i1.p1  ORF type:complete len:272 (-),score=71.76 TRINITY_DN3373_c0_g1_i1:117-932(-)
MLSTNNAEHTLVRNDTHIGIELHGWKVLVAQKNILKSDEIDRWTEELNMKVLPEMIFGNNYLRLDNAASNFSIVFNTFDALKQVDSKAVLPKVFHSEHWLKSKAESLHTSEIEQVPYEYDWTFTTAYRGSLSGQLSCSSTSDQFDFELLKRPDPILFFHELVLYEDELGDNGVTMLSAKVRVMPRCVLVLLRFWLRIDQVSFRAHETRFFHRFGSDHCLREYQERSAPYSAVVSLLGGAPDPAQLLDANVVVPLLPVHLCQMEKITLAKPG